MKWIVLCLLLLSTSTAKAELVIKLDEPVVSHEVSGTLEEVDKKIRDATAKPKPNYPSSAWTNFSYNLNGKTITLFCGIHVPVWKNRDKASKKDQALWDNFYKVVYYHELHHLKIARVFMQAAADKIDKLSNETDMVNTLNFHWSEMHKAHIEYDRAFSMDPGYVYPNGTH